MLQGELLSCLFEIRGPIGISQGKPLYFPVWWEIFHISAIKIYMVLFLDNWAVKRGCVRGHITCESCLLVVSDCGKIQCFELLVGKRDIATGDVQEEHLLIFRRLSWFEDIFKNLVRKSVKRSCKQKCFLIWCNSKENCTLSIRAVLYMCIY